MDRNSERLSKNSQSKASAINDGKPWTPDELEWLYSWDGTAEYLEELAELLGRTIEACREKFYRSRREEVEVKRTTTATRTTTTTTTTTYRGWMVGDDEGWD